MGSHHNHRKKPQHGPKQPDFVSRVLYDRLFSVLLMANDGHPQAPATSPYLSLPPPSVTQPQISPMAIQKRRYKTLA